MLPKSTCIHGLTSLPLGSQADAEFTLTLAAGQEPSQIEELVSAKLGKLGINALKSIVLVAAYIESAPLAVLSLPVELVFNARYPLAVLLIPVALLRRDSLPIAVLLFPEVLVRSA